MMSSPVATALISGGLSWLGTSVGLVRSVVLTLTSIACYLLGCARASGLLVGDRWALALAGLFPQMGAGAAAAAHPAIAVMRNNFALLHELGGDLGQAEELVRAALKDEPSQPQLSKNLGDLCYRASRYDEAWEAYSRAVELAPDLGDDVYFKLGNIAYKRNDRELAARLWRRALELNPGHELVKSNLETLSALS